MDAIPAIHHHQALGDPGRPKFSTARRSIGCLEFGLYGNTIDLKAFAPLVEGVWGAEPPTNVNGKLMVSLESFKRRVRRGANWTGVRIGLDFFQPTLDLRSWPKRHIILRRRIGNPA
jgi:hypothetical protein